jgi:hypothetical protein
VPLSEDEQRILSDIERRFHETDPEFAREVSESTIYRHAARVIRLATIAIVVGLVVLLTQFSSQPILGFAGFVAIFGGMYFIWVNLRRVGQASWQEFMHALRSGSLKSQVQQTQQDVRHRFHRRRGDHDE